MAHVALDADNRASPARRRRRLRHNAEIGQPGLCFSAYGHKFGINHLDAVLAPFEVQLVEEDAGPPELPDAGASAVARAWRAWRSSVAQCTSSASATWGYGWLR